MTSSATLDVSCVIICVDFADLLAVTLPANYRHFSRILVATTPEDLATQAVVNGIPNTSCYLTNVFTARGAYFNKGAAIEEALDVMGRSGWIAHMDADIVLPTFAWPDVKPGFLYSPLRRMMVTLPHPLILPLEKEWTKYPLHPQHHEHAGFLQLFHASDPVLRERPWYPTDFMHAGTSDSVFQAKWLPSHRIRLPFEVLHLGEAGVNWAGRAAPYADGSIDPRASERVHQLRKLIIARKNKRGPSRFDHEKLL